MIMGFEEDDRDEPNSTPKLTLSKLPYCKPREPLLMQTPPLRPSVSIPFHWEEAPGKPRAAADATASPPSSSKSKVARCLDLPPRLLQGDPNITILRSPTTVLDGPYVGRSLSLACTFSFRKGLVTEGTRHGKVRPERNFGSGRWGSFRHEVPGEGSSVISRSLGDIFRSEKNVKITGVGRRRSFFGLSTNKSNLWGDIYTSFKQVVPWKRGR